MVGYQKKTYKEIHVVMDQTVWLNPTLPVAAVEGDDYAVRAWGQLTDDDRGLSVCHAVDPHCGPRWRLRDADRPEGHGLLVEDDRQGGPLTFRERGPLVHAGGQGSICGPP